MKRHHPYFVLHQYCNWWYRRIWFAAAALFLKGLFAAVILVSSAVISLIEFSNPEEQQLAGVVGNYLVWIHGHRFTIVSLLLVIQCASGLLIWLLNRFSDKASTESQKIKVVLNQLVEQIFDPRSPDETYRATLFRERSCWLLGKWLGVVQRSGDVYVNWSTIFSINPNDRAQNTGIAGECWFRAQSGFGGRFHLKMDHLRDDLGRVEAYTLEGFLDPQEFDQLSVRACFFWACEIRRSGQVWGVLVVDSTDPSVFPTTTPARKKQSEAMKNAAKTISLLIE